GYEQVAGLALEQGELEAGPTAEQTRVRSHLDLTGALWANVRGPGHVADDGADMAADHLAALERRELLAEEWLVAGLAVVGPQLEVTSLSKEVRDAVRCPRLGEEVELVHVAVGARALGARGDGQQQPLPQPKPFLLGVQPDGSL